MKMDQWSGAELENGPVVWSRIRRGAVVFLSRLGELVKVNPFEDKRGILKKIYMKSRMPDKAEAEEVYLLYSNQNSVRGNHYHKKTVEYFTVISGRAKVALKDYYSNDYEEFYMSADDNVVLRVPPNLIHEFLNEDEGTLIILAISSKEYNEADKDSYTERII